MFDSLLERIRRVDEIESKLLSIFEGKSWEHIAKALYQILDDIDTTDDVCKENTEAFRSTVMKLQAKKNQFLFSPDGYTLEPVVEIDECVCHIYGLTDEKLLEFYGSMGDGWNAYNESFGSDKAEVEAELEKRGLDIPVNEGRRKDAVVNKVVTNKSEILSALRKALEKLPPRKDTFKKPKSNEPGFIADVPNPAVTKIKKLIRVVKNENAESIWNFFGAITQEVEKYSDIDLSINENLTGHARRELELAGMFDKEVEGSEAAGSWNVLCAEAVIELMEVFAGQGHSGFSASMTQDLFSRLSKFEALTELTDNSDEWNDISEMQSGEPGWQSSRNPSCFSEDGGKTYWDISEDYYLREDEEDGMVYSGSLSTEEWKNRPIHQSKHIEKKE